MLELIGLSRRFGEVVALDDLSFVVPEGRMLGFVGPNGAGKTTAMRIVLGVLEADRGDVRWRGSPLDAAGRRRFGYMPEERGLYPKMRVLDQLVYLARLHGLEPDDAKASAGRALDVLGLSRSNVRVETLSLGNQQRVQLAAALAHRPEALVLDEPFSGLDPVGVDVLSGVLREQAAAGVPVMFSSHQLDLVERLCESVVMVDHGRVVAAGLVRDLQDAGGRRLVRVDVAGASDGWFEGLAGVSLIERSPGRVILELHDGAARTDVLDAARAAGEVTEFSVVRPSLAELFREAVEA